MSIIDTTKAQITAIPSVQDDLCRACPKCVAQKACRTKAIIRIDPGEPAFIDPSRCYGCRACILACPFGAITINGAKEHP
ncbi:MAG: 4Fe-4S binding protein [Anaerolineae bacterium]|nr:4Fe-4S binding protein [Anaerolineae bacterium]